MGFGVDRTGSDNGGSGIGGNEPDYDSHSSSDDHSRSDFDRRQKAATGKDVYEGQSHGDSDDNNGDEKSFFEKVSDFFTRPGPSYRDRPSYHNPNVLMGDSLAELELDTKDFLEDPLEITDNLNTQVVYAHDRVNGMAPNLYGDSVYTLRRENSELEINQHMDTNGNVALGLDGEAKSPKGVTPLMVAAQNGHAKVVKLLLEKGADVNASTAVNGEKKTALDAAKEYGGREVTEILRQAGAKE